MELTNSLRQTVRSLDKAKARNETGLFVVEGNKCVLDTINYFNLHCLIATRQWLDSNLQHCGDIEENKIIAVPTKEIERLSNMKSTPSVIAVYNIPEYAFDIQTLETNLVIALDCVQDPGNLGTIIRTADWMGVYDIIASFDTVDVWSPKVIQSTMGAITRVRVHYVDNLAATLKKISPIAPIYGTSLDGENLYNTDLTVNGVIVMGNEGKGISADVRNTLTRNLWIPDCAQGTEHVESLNVAMATAITLAEFRRKILANK